MRLGPERPGRALGLGLALVLAPGVWPCSGPPALDLELVAAPGPGPVRVAIRPRVARGPDPLEAFAGVSVGDSGDRLVRLDGPAARQLGSPFSISPLGPSPSMLLQWGGFDAEVPEAPTRRHGYGLEVRGVHASGLPPPPGWKGPWDPGAERWYQSPGKLSSDRAAVRWLHRGIGSRVGEESEPWLKLERDAEGVPSRLHLWVVLAGDFAEPRDLWLRLEPARRKSVRVRWDWGDGSVDGKLGGPPEAPLLERLVATHVYAHPGEYQVRARVELDWLFGSWASGGKPWDWSIQVAYIGAVDLTGLGPSLSGPAGEELARRVDAVRSRLRCLPGDVDAPGPPGAAPCTYVPAEEPDRFLDPAGDAITALLEAVLPASLRDQAATLPLGGEGQELTFRYRFSGRFPHRSAPFDASPAAREALGASPTTKVTVPATE